MAASLRLLHERSVLRLAGSGVGKFLQGLCTQDTTLLQSQRAVAAAFLSPKGKVLCDTILVAGENANEVFIDCHRDVSQPLLRLLQRHRLREPIDVDDASDRLMVAAELPQSVAASSDHQFDDFFDDPRYRLLGRRGLVPSEAATTAQAHFAAEDYHRWRICCAVPEGPAEIPVDTVMPLHANLDLLGFISFSKGCYVGQELTARTKHRGAVRRRVATAVAASRRSYLADLPNGSPAPFSLSVEDVSLPLNGSLQMADSGEPNDRALGSVLSTSGAVALCSVRTKRSFNNVEDFCFSLVDPSLPLELADNGESSCVLVRSPPYAFLD